MLQGRVELFLFYTCVYFAEYKNIIILIAKTDRMFANAKAQDLAQCSPQELLTIDSRLDPSLAVSYQQALYTQFAQKRVCFQLLGHDRDFQPIYGLYGFMLEKRDLGMLRLHLLKVVHERGLEYGEGRKAISVVFFSKGQPKPGHAKKRKYDGLDFHAFKEEVVKGLQVSYLKCIKYVYVCHEGILARSLSMFSFSRPDLHTQLVDALLSFCPNMEALVESLGPLFECDSVSQQVQDYNGSVDWLSVFSEADRKSARKRMLQVVGDKASKSMVYCSNVRDYQAAQGSQVPVLLSGLLLAIQNSSNSLETEGIFRIACQEEKLRSLEQELKGYLTEDHVMKTALKHDGITVSCCIKTLFNNLNPPIVPYEVYDTLIAKMEFMFCSSIESSSKKELQPAQADQLLAHLAAKIGPQEKSILLRLIGFFRGAVIANERRNKMGAYNLSVVMGPCIFRPQKYSVSDLINSSRLAYLLSRLISDPWMLK